MHTLNVSLGDSIDYFKPLRKPKLSNKGIGGGGKGNPVKLKRSKLRPVSKKQRKRLVGLKEKREILLNAQHERWGHTFCMMFDFTRLTNVPRECGGRLDLAHVKPASRGGKDKDSFKNLGLLCRNHHAYFTRTPGLYNVEYRTPEMKKFCEELDSVS